MGTEERVRRLYLVRHGSVEFPDGLSRCIGITDLPLSEAGRRQAEDLERYFAGLPVQAVYGSKLIRAAETARILARGRWPVIGREDLRELDMGEWENVPLRDLRKTLEAEPEKGEGRIAGVRRFRAAVERCLDEQQGDLVIVAHAGVNCCLLAELLGEPLDTSRALFQPYGGISVIAVAPGGRWQVDQLGCMPKDAPTEEECEELWNWYGTPEEVRKHCRAVMRRAVELGKGQGMMDLDVIAGGALLHDLVRGMPEHALQGARLVRKAGYPRVADIIRQHHDLAHMRVDEAAVVYLADKQIQGEKPVSLEERFGKKRERFAGDEDALRACERRYRQAKDIEEMMASRVFHPEKKVL